MYPSTLLLYLFFTSPKWFDIEKDRKLLKYTHIYIPNSERPPWQPSKLQSKFYPEPIGPLTLAPSLHPTLPHPPYPLALLPVIQPKFCKLYNILPNFPCPEGSR